MSTPVLFPLLAFGAFYFEAMRLPPKIAKNKKWIDNVQKNTVSSRQLWASVPEFLKRNCWCTTKWGCSSILNTIPMNMKIPLIVLYVIAILFSFHQTTYWGYGAASCPLTNIAARERCLIMYTIYGWCLLLLISIPIATFIIWRIRRVWKKIHRRTLNKTSI